MSDHLKNRIGGLLIAVMGAAGTAYAWYAALYDGSFYIKAGLIFPAFAVAGAAVILFPNYREEHLARREAGLQGLRLLTPRWRLILGVVLAAGVVNDLLIFLYAWS